MPCDRCASLCVEYRIKVPAELRRAIAIAHENIADGTIEEVPLAAAAGYSDTPISNVKPDGSWDDVLHYRFRCSSCGELFELSAKTYHGTGGAWRPEDRASIRERP
jgi:hypothetical protein